METSLVILQPRKNRVFPQCSHPFTDQPSNIKSFLVSEIVDSFLGSIPAIHWKHRVVASIEAELKNGIGTEVGLKWPMQITWFGRDWGTVYSCIKKHENGGVEFLHGLVEMWEREQRKARGGDSPLGSLRQGVKLVKEQPKGQSCRETPSLLHKEMLISVPLSFPQHSSACEKLQQVSQGTTMLKLPSTRL